jgi:hypothetical protein
MGLSGTAEMSCRRAILLLTPGRLHGPDDSRSHRGQGRKRANGKGTISPRKDGRYEIKAYVLATAGRLERKSACVRSHEDARKKLTEAGQPV